MAVILDGIRVRVFPTSKKAQHYRNYDWHFKGCGYGNFLGKGISFVGWASLLLSLGLRVGSGCGSSVTKSRRVPGRLNSIAYSRFRGKFSVPLGEHPCCFHSPQPELSVSDLHALSGWSSVKCPWRSENKLQQTLECFVSLTCWLLVWLPISQEHVSLQTMNDLSDAFHPGNYVRVLIADFIVCLTWGKTHYFLKSQLECVPWSL